MGVPEAEPRQETEGESADDTAQDESRNEKSKNLDPGSGSIPENFTICSPQLLHLDVHGRPIWFNGWILPNKYIEEKQRETRFEGYIKEPKERGPWKLGDHNNCCLTSDRIFAFNQPEKDVLEMIVNIAKDVGALGSSSTTD